MYIRSVQNDLFKGIGLPRDVLESVQALANLIGSEHQIRWQLWRHVTTRYLDRLETVYTGLLYFYISEMVKN